MSVHVFGIRHHGPGSARALRQALAELEPDILLLEGAPEGEAILPLLADVSNLTPPVAMLLYRPDAPDQAVFYPMALFSPEWQALTYAYERAIPVRLMDLPLAHRLAMDAEKVEAENETAVPLEPLAWLAEAAGYADGESWWEQMVEQRRHSQEIFAAITEAMTAVRQTISPAEFATQPQELLREAAMRRTIRTAEKEGYQRIAVVCGAWHAPVLADMSPYPAKADQALLKGLPKVKIEATWIPWTYSKLTAVSGYGAGLRSPRWYEYLWHYPDTAVVHWFTAAAHLLRQEGFVASSAQVIDSVRLAETLTAVRQQHTPSLAELLDALQATMVNGKQEPLWTIHKQLVVGDRMGSVSARVPMYPLRQELHAQQKQLRLPISENKKLYELDLRKPLDLKRSQLWRRLWILGIYWGKEQRLHQKGTFRETWQVQWEPEMYVQLGEMAIWGNTIAEAANAFTIHLTAKATYLLPLVENLHFILKADLPKAATDALTRLGQLAALSNDVSTLMDALPQLVQILRYGDVRQTDGETVAQLVDQLIIHICLGLPFACQSLNDDAANEMHGRLQKVSMAIHLLQQEEASGRWIEALRKLADMSGLHGLLVGACCEQLLSYGLYDNDEIVRRMRLALAPTVEPAQAGAWLNGFLAIGGSRLLYDDRLWQAVDDWLVQLSADNFKKLLPLLRRTFAAFADAERAQMAVRARQGHIRSTAVDLPAADNYLPEALAVVAQLLGLTWQPQTAVEEVAHG